MAMAANNVVLVGDQMQLSQPIQGSHPSESGMSGLDYLLRNKATIPPEHGIFLATTYRMHEHVCRFISDAVYEGRLHPAPDNQRQRLILSGQSDPALRTTGVQFIEVEHSGCSQKSEEEGSRIRELYHSLLSQQYVDRKGERHSVTKDNILVIAPYNVQVKMISALSSRTAKECRVNDYAFIENHALVPKVPN